VCLELVADDGVVPLRVRVTAVDDVDEDPRPLDVAQEGVAQPRAGRGSLDESRHVRDRGPALVVRAERHDAEVRLQRREGVCGDLGVAAVRAASSVDLPALGSPRARRPR